jgi:FKBP-type peptidyl-prolyl cis-trans isomerase FkpA
MKKYFTLLCIFIIGLSSCKKTATFDAAAQAVTDEAVIKSYITTYNITGAIRDPSGLYYQIIAPGTGTHPTSNSNVTVAYKLSLTDGTVLEDRSSYNFQLGGLIEGWKIGVPFIANGGTILLMIPSGLGYKNVAQGSIPANSVLIYKITLQGFN